MNQPSDDRGRLPVLRMAGVGLGVWGATVGGVAGWFTLAGAGQDVAAASSGLSGSVGAQADGSTVGLGTGQPHTRTGGF